MQLPPDCMDPYALCALVLSSSRTEVECTFGSRHVLQYPLEQAGSWQFVAPGTAIVRSLAIFSKQRTSGLSHWSISSQLGFAAVWLVGQGMSTPCDAAVCAHETRGLHQNNITLNTWLLLDKNWDPPGSSLHLLTSQRVWLLAHSWAGELGCLSIWRHLWDTSSLSILGEGPQAFCERKVKYRARMWTPPCILLRSHHAFLPAIILFHPVSIHPSSSPLRLLSQTDFLCISLHHLLPLSALWRVLE